MFHRFLVLSLVLMYCNMTEAQKIPTIYEEENVPKYTLPDPLIAEDGTPIKTAKQWINQRRPEILKIFEEQVYGRAPEFKGEIQFKVLEEDKNALGGKAIRKQVKVQLTNKADGPSMELLIYSPKNAKGPVPTFLTLNFYGNHTIHTDPAIHLSESWVRNNSAKGTKDNRATEKSRGASAERWPVERILERGFAIVAIYYGDIDPDFDDDFQNGVHPHYLSEGQKKPGPDQWGSISAWAWGLSRAMDYLEKDSLVDPNRVAVMGHSRLGKTSIWAGAQDTRFKVTICNNSGCGGAALNRRRFGESVRRINTSFPHWFCDNYVQYNDNEGDLAVDQHMLVSLIAPRAILICSAEEDRWADPKGEFLSAFHADSVYRLLGVEGIAAKEMPGLDQPVMSPIGYKIRPGKHNVLASDWEVYMDFANKHFTK